MLWFLLLRSFNFQAMFPQVTYQNNWFCDSKVSGYEDIPLYNRIHDLNHLTSFVLLRVLQESDHSVFLVDKGMYLTILNLQVWKEYMIFSNIPVNVIKLSKNQVSDTVPSEAHAFPPPLH